MSVDSCGHGSTCVMCDLDTTGPPRPVDSEPSILEAGIAGTAFGFAAWTLLVAVWAAGVFLDWLISRVPGVPAVSLIVSLAVGFLAGVWERVYRE